jgi:glycosyltransferase involved in cell wall biosynthesis
VTYLGPLDRERMTAARTASAVVVAVPTWEDVLPTVILEAMAAGRPVVGTAVGGIPYLLGIDTATKPAGWVVKPDPAALAGALAIARTDAVAVAPGARERYLTAFHPDVLTSQLVETYTTLSANFRAGRR